MKQLLAARCNVDLRDQDGHTALKLAQRQGYHAVRIAMLLRSKKQNGTDKAKQESPESSPDKTKRQQEDADRAMVELLEEGKACFFCG